MGSILDGPRAPFGHQNPLKWGDAKSVETLVASLMEILATDPAAPADFEAFCKETDHSFVSIDEDDGVYRIILRKKASG